MSTLEADFRIEQNPYGGEMYVFDPYNPQNIIITREEIESILRTYGIPTPVHNLHLYQRAFVHQSYLNCPPPLNKTDSSTTVIIAKKPDDCISLYTKSNERLEYVGDGVLELITKYYLYRRFPKEEPGFLTDTKIALVQNKSIGKMALDMGLHKWLIMSKSAELKGTRTNLKRLGCLFEAFLGALFLDFNKIQIHDSDHWFESLFVVGPGFQMAQIFIEQIFEKHVNWMDLIQNDRNFKNILQEKIQKEFKTTPEYVELIRNENGYNMGVYLCLGQAIYETKTAHSIPLTNFTSYQDIHEYMCLHGKILVFLGMGKHKNKKEAEQMGCESAIQYLSTFA